jgi:hypothetical protein
MPVLFGAPPPAGQPALASGLAFITPSLVWVVRWSIVVGLFILDHKSMALFTAHGAGDDGSHSEESVKKSSHTWFWKGAGAGDRSRDHNLGGLCRHTRTRVQICINKPSPHDH